MNARASMILGACLLQTAWGATLLCYPEATGLRTTDVSLAIDTFGSQHGAGLAFLAASALSIAAVTVKRLEPLGLALLVFQLFTLVLTFTGSAQAVWAGCYADHTPRPRGFIFIGQAAAMLVTVCFFIEYLSMSARGLWIRH